MDAHPHLIQEWIHSHEEDKGKTMVFRPPSYDFPLSRGRQSLNLQKGGLLTEGGPGPTDRSQSSDGTWQVDGKTLMLQKPGEAERKFEIASSSPDKLVLNEQS